jgi:heptosyltransferase-2
MGGRVFVRHGIVPADLIIVIIPGATFGSSKCWQDSSFAAVADALIQQYQAKILIIPGPGELEIAQSIIRKMEQPPIVMGDQVLPLDQLMALIRRCSLLITNDTGPRHFGVAFNKPGIVIMGPTDPRYTDYQLDKTIVLRDGVDCAPCHLKECPTDHRCMTRITPDRVLSAAREMIEEHYPACRQ